MIYNKRRIDDASLCVFMDIRLMPRIAKIYSYINILSIDIALGAVICALFFAKILNVVILPYGIIALALSVWIIYTADHLRDAIDIKKTASSVRHRFHQRYFKILLAILCLAIIVTFVVTLYARKPVFRWGINIGSLVIIYLLIQRFLKFLKEVFIATLYTCGVLVPSLSVTTVDLTTFHYLLFVQFGCVALMNLHIYSWFDYESDMADSQQSFATTVGKNITLIAIHSMCMLVLGISVLLSFQDFNTSASILITAMALLHLVILWLSNSSWMQNNFRIIADSIFFVPLIYLCLLG